MEGTTDIGGWFTPGQEVAGLRIERFLGRGAFSDVYLARDALIDRVVALKVLHPVLGEQQRPVTPAEVLNEARLVGKITSRHIVTLYRVHPPTNGGRWMFEMEYVEGGSLEDQLAGDRRLPWGQAVPLLKSITQGLRDAHAAGVVHGDVKAENVLLGLDGTARLADFGMARLIGDAPFADRVSGTPHGTPLYMAPEVFLGQGGEVASDLWSLGVLLYRTLVGRFPFPSDDFHVLFHAVQSRPPEPLGPDVPAPVAEAILACLAKRPEDRPPEAEAVLARLEDVSARSGSASRSPAPAGGPLLGRDEHVARAAAGLDASEVVVLTGPAGCGRSAVLGHLAARGRSRGETWLLVGLPSTGGFLAPLFEAIRGVLGESAGTWATEQRFGSGATLIRTVLEEGLEGHESQGPWIVRDLLQVLAESSATVLAIDDIQNANDQDRHLLTVLRRLPGGVVTSRLEEQPDAPVDQAVQSLAGERPLRMVPLGPLPAEAIYALIGSRSGAERVDATVRTRIVELASGNPLFALDLLRHMEASEAVQIKDGELVPGDGWSSITLPQRLQDVAASRLAALAPDERELLDVAAVDGESFDGAAVAAVTDSALLDVLRSLQRLYRQHGIVVPEERGYRFAHRILHDAVYDGVAPELRQALHLRLAEHLEERKGSDPPDPARVGEHWAKAGKPLRARPHLIRALGQAAKEEDVRVALALAERAELAPSTIERELLADHLEDLLGLAYAYHQSGASDESHALYARLLELTAEPGDEIRRGRVLAHQAWTRYATVGMDEAVAEDLLRLSEGGTEPHVRATALAALGRHALEKGEYAQAEAYLKDADATWARLGETREQGALLMLLANCARRSGRLREAEQFFAEAAEANRRRGQRLLAIACDSNRLLTMYERGGTRGLERGLVRAIHQFELIDAVNQAVHVRCILASVRHALGDAEGALAVQEDALARAERLGYQPALTMAYPNLARWRLAAGDFARASELRRAWGALTDRADPAEGECERKIFDARVAGLQGRSGEARELATEAVEMVLGLKTDRQRVRQVASLSESAHYGVPADPMPPLEAALAEADLPDDSLPEFADAFLSAALLLSDPGGDPGKLRDAALSLRDQASAESRANRLCAAGWLLSVAAWRAGDHARAADEANRALATAVALQNVWLQMHLLGVLARVYPGDVYAERRDDLIRHVARNLESSEERERFAAFWSATA